MCRAPHGARGLKFISGAAYGVKDPGRAPHGARGLKFPLLAGKQVPALSRPARGAWIEM